MKKIPTLLPKDPTNLVRVIPGPPLYPIDELTFRIKLDGTACAVIEGKPYVRYDARSIKVKRGKTIHIPQEQVLANIPEGAIPCQEPDIITGHWPHWVPLLDQPQYWAQREGFDNSKPTIDGTYECLGPGLQANPHEEEKLLWINHLSDKLIVNVDINPDNSYEDFKELFLTFPWEGVVAYKDGVPAAKLKQRNFGYENCKYQSVSNLGLLNEQ